MRTQNNTMKTSANYGSFECTDCGKVFYADLREYGLTEAEYLIDKVKGTLNPVWCRECIEKSFNNIERDYELD